MRSVGTEVRSTVSTVYYCEVKRNGRPRHAPRRGGRVPLQHGARHHGHGGLRGGGEAFAGGRPAILDGRVRTAGPPPAPPGGLCLTACGTRSRSASRCDRAFRLVELCMMDMIVRRGKPMTADQEKPKRTG
jgi:hypothetical protein